MRPTIMVCLLLVLSAPAGAEWARYDTTTRHVRHWSTVPFTVPPPAGQADQQFPAGTTLPGPISQSQLTPDLQGLQIDPASVPPLPPDWAGFLKWMPTAFDFTTINTLSNAYSSFFAFAQFGNAAGVQWCITDAKTKGTITAAHYALFQNANTTYHLGMTLP